MYASLHNRSAYSFGTALTTPVQLAAFAYEQRMPAMALTDWEGLYAAIAFQEECRGAGVRPIFGVEMGLAEGFGVTLLAQSLRGYANLCRLISRRHVEGRPVGVADVVEFAEELICLIGHGLGDRRAQAIPSVAPCGAFSPTGVAVTQGLRPGLLTAAPAGRAPSHTAGHASRPLMLLREAFGGRVYVELAIHRCEDVVVARRRAAMADALGIPVVASCESRCVRREQMGMLRALASIGTLTLLDRPHPDKPAGYWHLRTPKEMARLFARRPDALENTLRIAEQCDVTLDLDRNRFPGFAAPDGRSAAEHLRELCVAGCRRRYVEQPPQRGMGGKRPTLDEALQRLERELTIIEQVHYAEYFLVFHGIVEYCRSRGIATLARGSAADSLVCYALGVSHACPFRFDLPFDRFINAERAKFSKMADIDLDLPWDRRDEVIRWVYDRWGNDHVAMIGAPNTFHARAAVAELGKVYGLPPHEVHRVTKSLPHAAAHDLPHILASSPEARQIPAAEEPYRTILNMAVELEGLPRHWTMHPCGLVVSPEPLTDLVPVQPSPKGPLVAQYDMDAIEALGFVKIDLLGQAGLSVLRDTVAEIERTDGVRIDLTTDVDYSDTDTWELIATGNARGVHHIESPAMTSLLQQCGCRDIDCLTAVVALIRPGAANQGKKEMFARRHTGLEPPCYAHPSLESVLAGTYGIMVFEEHILQIATQFAGMNLGQADVLRRALNKQNRKLLVEMRTQFVAHARQRGRTGEEIVAVWSLLEGFSGFMFNKAHSAEYAVEAFQGAWLKRRWPAHYLAAILSNYRGFYAHSPTLPQIVYVMEALRLGIGLLPPCVNDSRPGFSVCSGRPPCSAPAKPCRPFPQQTPDTAEPFITEGKSSIPSAGMWIRIPVAHINGLSEAFLKRYLDQRRAGRFASLEDFVERCRPGEAEGQMLLDASALDGFGECRPELFWQLRAMLRRKGDAALFAGAERGRRALGRGIQEKSIALSPPDARQMARRERELLGFPVTLDPLTYLGGDDQGRNIDWSRYTPVARLHQCLGRRVHVCGLMVADRISGTLGGGLMKFVTLSDRTGFVETILFPDVYRRFGHLTAAHPILAATGIVEPFETGQGFTLRVQSVQPPARSGEAGGRVAR